MSAPDCPGRFFPADREIGRTVSCPICSGQVVAVKGEGGLPSIPPHEVLVTEDGVHGPRCGEGAEPEWDGALPCTCNHLDVVGVLS